jgi:hypothetical protein
VTRFLFFVDNGSVLVSHFQAMGGGRGGREKWKTGRLEDWKCGRLEEWKTGRLEE